MTTLDHLTTAILTAEAQARADHEAGTCQEGEWSCSWCPGGTNLPRRTLNAQAPPTAAVEGCNRGLDPHGRWTQ